MYLRIIYDLTWPISSASLSWFSKADAHLASTMMKEGCHFSIPAWRASYSSITTSIAVSHCKDIGGIHRFISFDIGQKKPKENRVCPPRGQR